MNNKLKKIIIILGIIFIVVIFAFIYDINKNKEPIYTITNESLKFKNEYEILNDKDDGNDNKYLNISIRSYNQVIYSSYEEVFELIESGTGIIYFGFPECPWCRNLVPILIDSALENNIKEIYYLNIKDDRNVLTLNKKGKIKKEKEGSKDYLKLVDYLKDYLPTYRDLNDDSIKRIYMPTVVFVKDGKILGVEESLDSYSKRVNGNPYIPMNNEEKNELTNIFESYYKKIL